MTDSNNPENPSTRPSISYKDAGVDIDAGNALVDRVKGIAKATRRKEVLGSLGGFAAMCEIPEKYQHPVLVAGTDGVGTKLKLAMDLGLHQTIGIDLVAMCVNDLIVGGAEPLFFLDYYATGKLNVDVAVNVIEGIGEGCRQANCALVGGETAEMPGMYEGEDYDLAGFCVGVVEKSKIIDGSKVKPGDQLIAIASSGPHSNGYSLIRKIIELNQVDLQSSFADSTLGQYLIEPTRIYTRAILSLMEIMNIHALSHITGGGFSENIPRILPEQVAAQIYLDSWQIPAIFEWLQTQGNIEQQEMYRTFNCGVGMIICVPQEQTNAALESLHESEENAWVIGAIVERQPGMEQVIMSDSRDAC